MDEMKRHYMFYFVDVANENNVVISAEYVHNYTALEITSHIGNGETTALTITHDGNYAKDGENGINNLLLFLDKLRDYEKVGADER